MNTNWPGGLFGGPFPVVGRDETRWHAGVDGDAFLIVSRDKTMRFEIREHGWSFTRGGEELASTGFPLLWAAVLVGFDDAPQGEPVDPGRLDTAVEVHSLELGFRKPGTGLIIAVTTTARPSVTMRRAVDAPGIPGQPLLFGADRRDVTEALWRALVDPEAAWMEALL